MPMENNARKIQHGILDLSGWDLETDGIVKLDGDWEFYWNRFIQPDQFYQENPPLPDGYIYGPHPWNDFKYQGKPLDGAGFCTYRLRIVSDHFPSVVTLDINSLSTSYVMYINGTEVAKVGQIGTSKNEMTAEYRPVIVSFAPEGNVMDVVIQMSNYHHSQGGLWDKITLGTEKEIRLNHNSGTALFLLIAGSLIIIGLYHLAMYSLNNYTKSPFFLGILSINLGVRSLITGDMTIYYFIPSIPWELLVRVEYFTVVIGISVFVLYQYNLFKEHFNKTVLYIVLGVTGIYTAVILFSSAYFFTSILDYYLIINGIFILYALIVNIQAIIYKNESAWGFMVAFIILMVSYINDTLNAMEIITTGYFSSIGILAFIGIQAVTLSAKLTGAFRTVEKQNFELTIHREKLEEHVKIRTEELEKANTRLKKMTVIDALTQIPNRRRFDEYIDTEWARLKRVKQPMSLVLCDIDYFKKYNDNYGHQQGDDCLEQVAQALKNSVKRPGDLVARYGGEEFCSVLPNTPTEGAEKIAEEMRKNIQSLKIPHEKSDVSEFVSISVGVAEMTPADNNKAAELIELADKSLYSAKDSGRNCVICLSGD